MPGGKVVPCCYRVTEDAQWKGNEEFISPSEGGCKVGSDAELRDLDTAFAVWKRCFSC